MRIFTILSSNTLLIKRDVHAMKRSSNMQYSTRRAELISSTLKVEAIFSSETSVETQRAARRIIPDVTP
jgi:hypothetical protein